MAGTGIYADFVSVGEGLELNKPFTLAMDYGITTGAVLLADALQLQDKLLSGGDSQLLKTLKNGAMFWAIGRSPKVVRALTGI